jgi:uncharacterized membrane-anchored protein
VAAPTLSVVDSRTFRAPKVPEVFLLFWVVKLLTTGIGEAGADAMAKVSIPLAGAVGLVVFVVALRVQLRAEAYHPVRYWLAVLAVAVFGTMVADGPHKVLGIPYIVNTIICIMLLAGLLIWWGRSEGTLSVHSVTTARRERFYWAAVLITFGLGTALGDTTALTFQLGFAGSILLFGVAILVPLGLWRLGAGATAMFWSSYVLTRPLGASVADWLGKSTGGGRGWGDGVVFAVGMLVFIVLVGYLWATHSDVEGAHAASHHVREGAAPEHSTPTVPAVTD